jgi:uncharacterized membrane protein YhaH (DUF805 family)
MKGEVLNYDDNSGTGQISGADGIRYSFTRADLKQLVPITRGTRVDFDFEGKAAHDIYIDSAAPQAAMPAAATVGVQPYNGPVEPDLGLWGYFVQAFTRKFASFSGRARRKEYWGFYLFTLIFAFVLFSIIGIVIAATAGGMHSDAASASSTNAITGMVAGMGIIGLGIFGIFCLVLILPALGVTTRRFHDIGWSGWIVLLLYVLSLIPYVGLITSIIFIVVACIDSQPGTNKYGPPPKRV